jgi:hypothetical protein
LSQLLPAKFFLNPDAIAWPPSMVQLSQDSAIAAFKDLLPAQALLSTFKTANAELLRMLEPRLSNGTAAAHAQTTRLTETLSSI